MCLIFIHYIWPRNQKFTVASAPVVTDLVFICRFRSFTCKKAKAICEFAYFVVFKIEQTGSEKPNLPAEKASDNENILFSVWFVYYGMKPL